MQKFNTKIDYSDSDNEFKFECYENTEPIEIGDYFIFFFGGIADVQKCNTDGMKFEINPNDMVEKKAIIDLVTGFWKNCYKIKSTNFNLTTV